MSAGRLDLEPAPLEPARKRRGLPLWKSALFSALSALTIFLVWLLYPLSAPEYSLRRHLPAECIAVVETHAPQKFAAGLSQTKSLKKFQQLPLWPLLADLLRQPGGVSPEKLTDQLQTALQAAAGELFGLRNVLAAAAGPYLMQDSGTALRDFAAILPLDNLGLTLAKVGLLFSGTGTENGVRYVKIPLSDPNVPALYMAVAPQTRFLMIASDPVIFNRFRFGADAGPAENFNDLTVSALPTPQPSAEPGQPQPAPEAALTPDTAVVLRMDMDSANASGLLRSFLPGQARQIHLRRFRADLFWNLNEFGGRGEVVLDSAAGAIPPLKVGAFLPPENFRGLATSFALPPEFLTGAMQLALPTDPLAKKMFQSVDPFMDGRGYLAFCAPPAGSSDLAAGILWGVSNPEAARKKFVDAADQTFKTLAAKQTDLGMIFLFSSLNFTRTADGATLQLPLPGSASALACAFGQTAAGGYGALKFGDSGLFLPGSALPVLPQEHAQTALVWQHSPELMEFFRQSVLKATNNADWAALVLGPGQVRKLSESLPQALRGLDVLDSIEALRIQTTLVSGTDATASQQRTAQEGTDNATVLRWESRGRLRFAR